MKEKLHGLNQTARITFDTIKGLGVEFRQATREELKNFKNGKSGDWIVRVCGQPVMDRDGSGDWVTVSRNKLFRFKQRIPSKHSIAWACRKALREHFEHEIDEGLFVDGERVYDPHKKEENESN